MKKMLSVWRVNKPALLMLPLFVLGLFLAGFLMAVIIIAIGEETTSFPMGTIIGALALVAGALIYAGYYRREFILALTMGSTRKEFLLSFALRHILLMAGSFGMLLLLGFAEIAAYSRIFPGIVSEFDIMPHLLNPGLVLCIAAVTLALTLFLGALFCRYGRKAMLSVYFGYLLLCFSTSRLVHSAWLGRLLRTVSPIGWLGISLAAAAAMLTTTVVLAKKQMVN